EARLERVRRSHERPSRGDEIFGRQIGACFDEARVVAYETSVEPGGGRLRARHDKNVTNLSLLDVSRRRVSPRQRLEMALANEVDDFRLGSDGNRWMRFESTNQIPRHALRECFRANEDVDMSRGAGEKHRRLSSGIASTDDNDLFTAAQLCL